MILRLAILVELRRLVMDVHVFDCVLKEARELAVVTLVGIGRLFHARAAITRKERHPRLDH